MVRIRPIAEADFDAVAEVHVRSWRFYERAGLTADGTRQTWTPDGSEVELPELRYATAL